MSSARCGLLASVIWPLSTAARKARRQGARSGLDTSGMGTAFASAGLYRPHLRSFIALLTRRGNRFRVLDLPPDQRLQLGKLAEAFAQAEHGVLAQRDRLILQ